MSTPDLLSVATSTGLSTSAIQTLFDALIRGGGSQAQFDHPELGGHGQWMRGGMLMIGDMFNDSLKAKVARACEQLSPLAVNIGSTQPTSNRPNAWWPKELGDPASVAGQDDLSYALFAHQLAVRTDDGVKIYDLGDATPHGVGMQNGAIVVRTSHGDIPLTQLRLTHG